MQAVRLVGVSVFVAFASCGPGLAGDMNGFVSGKGRGGIGLSYTGEGFDDFWMGSARVADPMVGRLDRKSVSLWLGYGITDDLMVVVNMPYVRSRSRGVGGFRENALQDLVVMGKYRVASLGNGVKSDLVGAAGVRMPLSDYRIDNPGNVGDHTTDVLLRAIYQLRYRRFYLSQQVGYDVRSEGAPNSVPLFTEAGIGYHRVTFSAFYGKQITGSGFDIGQPGFTFPTTREEYDRIGAKVFVSLTRRFGVSVAGFETLGGRNTSDAAGIGGGVFIGF